MLANLERFDVYEGVVIRTNEYGALIKLLDSEIEAFAFACARPGDRVLVSISKVNVKTNRVRCQIDSFRYSAA